MEVSWKDSHVAALLDIAESVDRAAFGLSSIEREGAIYRQDGGCGFDTMLHIDEHDVVRTISFVRQGTGYKWIGEQEAHLGPKEQLGPERTFGEAVLIEYQTEPVAPKVPTKQTLIMYIGEDSRLAGRTNLTLNDVRPILAEWKIRRKGI
jgi:hypothetical protein